MKETRSLTTIQLNSTLFFMIYHKFSNCSDLYQTANPVLFRLGDINYNS